MSKLLSRLSLKDRVFTVLVTPSWLLKLSIRFLGNERGIWVHMCPAIVLRIVTGDTPVSYWPIFFPVVCNSPEIFANVNLVQFPSQCVSVNFLLLLVQFNLQLHFMFSQMSVARPGFLPSQLNLTQRNLLLVIMDLTKPRRRRQREREKTVGSVSNTTTLHVHHAFLYISLPSLHNNGVK